MTLTVERCPDFYPQARAAARKWGWEGDDLEDLTQHVMMRLVLAARRIETGSVQDPIKPETWVFGVFARGIHDYHGMQGKGRYALRAYAERKGQVSLDAAADPNDESVSANILATSDLVVEGGDEVFAQIFTREFIEELRRVLGPETVKLAIVLVEHVDEACAFLKRLETKKTSKPTYLGRLRKELGMSKGQFETARADLREFTAGFLDLPEFTSA